LVVATGTPVLRRPPGPRGWPYFGCLGALLRDPMELWSTIANRYGGIARVPLMRQTVYLVSDPTLLYELLVTNRHKNRKNIRYRAAVELFGAGLLLNEGDAWKRQRLMSQPAFKADYVAGQIPWMAELTAGFFDGWRPAAERRQVFDVDREFLSLSQRLAGYYLMGPGFAAIAERFCQAAVDVKNAWPKPPRHVLEVLMRLRRGPAAGWSPALESAIQRIDSCVYEYLAEQRKQDFADAGLVTMLVRESRAQQAEFDDRSLRDQVLTLFFAGHETSATSLSWVHYLLSQHPSVRAKLRAEVGRVLGKRAPTMQDLDELHYTEQVVNESLRLYSPIHSISRVALEPDTLGGYAVPEGATIYVSLYATHRLEQFWPDPERFDPDRFTPERNERRPRFAFIPFAAGHRNCIGGTTAIAELKLAIALLAQRYELDLAPGHRVESAAGTTMYPRYGMNMLARAV
jgi:cytochrome P450